VTVCVAGAGPNVEAALNDSERSIWDQGGLGIRAGNAGVGLGVIVSVLESAGTSISGLGVLNDWSPGRDSRTIASRAVAHIVHFDAEIVVSVPMLGVTERRRMAGKGRGQLRGHNRTPVHVVEDSVVEESAFGEGEEKVDIHSYICRGLAHNRGAAVVVIRCYGTGSGVRGQPESATLPWFEKSKNLMHLGDVVLKDRQEPGELSIGVNPTGAPCSRRWGQISPYHICQRTWRRMQSFIVLYRERSVVEM
jgi:hypothetical protein